MKETRNCLFCLESRDNRTIICKFGHSLLNPYTRQPYTIKYIWHNKVLIRPCYDCQDYVGNLPIREGE